MDACKTIKQIASAMENGEYDFDGTPEKHVSGVSLNSYIGQFVYGYLWSAICWQNSCTMLILEKYDCHALYITFLCYFVAIVKIRTKQKSISLLR